MRYRVTEGGLKPSAIARVVLGELSRRASRVTSHLITRRGTGNEAVNVRSLAKRKRFGGITIRLRRVSSLYVVVRGLRIWDFVCNFIGFCGL